MELEWSERSLPGSDDLEKRGAYMKDSTGRWERPAPLAVSCPQCKRHLLDFSHLAGLDAP